MTAPPEIAEQRAAEWWDARAALSEHFEPSHKGDDQ